MIAREYAPYLEALRDGISLITPGRRLAGLVADRYGTDMRDQGTWEAPSVMPLRAWLTERHAHLVETAVIPVPGVLLSPDQELALWEQVVDRVDANATLPVETLARLAADAWSTKTLWQVPPGTDRYGHRTEVRAFARWARRFERRCGELDVIDHASFAARLADADPAVTDRFPPFRFFGFVRLPALLQRLAARCRAGGAFGLDGDGAAIAAVPARGFAHADAEIAAAMRWSGSYKSAEPYATVCVALAGVNTIDSARRLRLQRALSVPGGSEAAPVLDCPASGALADEPVVATALLLLDDRRERPWQDISRVIMSPYIGGAAEERDARARLDCELRRNGDTETTWQAVIALASRTEFACPLLKTRLEAVLGASRDGVRRARLHDWMAHAEKVLAAAGWPGDHEPEPAEQGALLDWSRVMDSVAALDAVMPPCGRAAAFAKWRALLRQRRPLAGGAVGAVRIVSLEEAAFVAPDRVWVAGLNDTAWPAPADGNPLLPLALLREHAVPGSEPALELRDAETVLQHLARHAGECVFSYAASEDDTPRRAFAGLNIMPADPETVETWARASCATEHVVDDSAPPLAPDGGLHGGVAPLTDIAACPFRAVARHRLHADTPEDPTPGLNALQRGTLVHALMASFWDEMKTSARLQGTARDAVDTLLVRAAREAIARARSRYRLPDPHWDLEQHRLVALGHEWLQTERARGEFEVVACEKTVPANVGDLSFTTRIDRIDRLADGTTLIIDYKSGKVTGRAWEPPRPDEPQLPIYATATGAGDVGGIAYAQVRPGECRLVDYPKRCAGPAGTTGEARAEWFDRRAQWQTSLVELAAELGHGRAAVDPKRGAATCRYCDLSALCRIDEAPGDRGETDEPAAG